MNKRLGKKKRVGDFKELGISGGGGRDGKFEGFVTRIGRGSALRA